MGLPFHATQAHSALPPKCHILCRLLNSIRSSPSTIPLWVGAKSTGDGFSHRCGRNDKFCVVMCPATRTADILLYASFIMSKPLAARRPKGMSSLATYRRVYPILMRDVAYRTWLSATTCGAGVRLFWVQWPTNRRWQPTSCEEAFSYNRNNLFRNLSKVVDEADSGGPLEWVVNRIDVNVAFVEQMVEHIYSFHGCQALLLVAEYQIDPLV